MRLDLSIPNWYWRTWEVLFGVVAACVPTLRPLYKWLAQEYARLTSSGNGSKTSARQWMRLKKSSTTLPKKDNGSHAKSGTREEDKLPLQNLEGASGSDNVELEVPKQGHESETSSSPNFKPGLHLHEDLSTNRPGHFKRWDSEARIGNGHGVEEIEDRI